MFLSDLESEYDAYCAFFFKKMTPIIDEMKKNFF